jgi:iron complex transport system substrate-binding protein
VDELIHLAGGRNVFADADVAWPLVSLEAVVARAPEVIVMPDDAAATLAGRPGWSAVPAVRAGRVVRVPAALFHRPGPRLPEAARTLAAAIGDAMRHVPPGPR